jgi:hypothetical protein
MSVEQGIVALLLAADAVKTITTNGGWYEQLPPDAPMPNWSYMTIFKHPLHGLQAKPGLIPWMVQFDVYSENDNGVGCLQLAGAFKSILDGYAGTLPNGVGVDSAFWEDERDHELDPARRTWRRSLDFRVTYFYGTP